MAAATPVTVEKMPEGTGNVELSAAAKTGKVTVENQPPVQIPLNIIRLNDIAVAGVGGNVTTEIGEKFKAASPVAHTTMITVTSGTVGYILTDEEYQHSGHNAMGSLLKPGCAENAIVQGLMDLIQASR